MFPSPPRNFSVDCKTFLPAIALLGSRQPSIHHKARTRIQRVRLGRRVDGMEGVKQGRCRDLRGVLGRGPRPEGSGPNGIG